MRALICGVAGQDGAYLAKLLLEKGYEVIGTSCDAMAASFVNLAQLGIDQQVETTSRRLMISAVSSKRLNILRLMKSTILLDNLLWGFLSTNQSKLWIVLLGGTLNLLEAIRFVDQPIRFYNAGSSECFGDTSERSADEETPFHPRSPYAVAKASAHWLVQNYRESYGLYACTGILFNHESPLRPERFVTQKIVRAAARIATDSNEKLRLGNIDIQRDWGWAPDYVVAMWRMLQMNKADDYVIATGRTVSLEYFIAKAFGYFSLDWKEHVVTDNSYLRPSDIRIGKANPKKAREELGWNPATDVDQVIERMCNTAIMNCPRET